MKIFESCAVLRSECIILLSASAWRDGRSHTLALNLCSGGSEGSDDDSGCSEGSEGGDDDSGCSGGSEGSDDDSGCSGGSGESSGGSDDDSGD